MLAKNPGPSERGADYWLITYESPSGVEEDGDSASDTEIVWAKSARGVVGLANVFANEKLDFTHDFLEPKYLPRGWSPLSNLLPKLLPKLPISCQTLNQECNQTGCPGGSQACSKACSWRALSSGPC